MSYPVDPIIQQVDIPEWFVKPLRDIAMSGTISGFKAEPYYLENYNIHKEFNQWLTEQVGTPVECTVDYWCNFVLNDGEDNTFKWHDETEMDEGNAVGILWLMGEECQGGNLQLIKSDKSLLEIEFKPGTLIRIPKTMYHCVTHYNGTSIPRVAFNFTYDELV